MAENTDLSLWSSSEAVTAMISKAPATPIERPVLELERTDRSSGGGGGSGPLDRCRRSGVLLTGPASSRWAIIDIARCVCRRIQPGGLLGVVRGCWD
jgi:hypothetical protein